MKRTLSIILIIYLMLSVLPLGILGITASAATYGDLTYTIVNDEIAITRCSTYASGSVHIPSELEGYPVTQIYGSAFLNCTNVTSVYIPSTVTKIESGVFSCLRNLEGIYVDAENQNYCTEDGVLFTKDRTSLLQAPRTLTEYVIPNTVTEIGISAFEGCKNLNKVTIGDKVTSIGSSAFYECSSLTSIKIPDSVKTIAGSTFYGCSNLSNVEFGNSVTTIGDYAFNYCRALTSISLPDSVTDINRAFNQCTGLTSIDIGNVKTLDYRAFWGCSELSSITIGSSFTRVGSNAFEGCESLINVYYYGTEEQWQKVTISDGNFYLAERATVHYVHDCQWVVATCAMPKTCSVCGATEGTVNPANHSNTPIWTRTPTTHKLWYGNCCDLVLVEEDEHEWDNGMCTVCTILCEHDGGSATCAEQAVCEICGKAYGSALGHDWNDATCTAPKTCESCGVTEGSALGHDWVRATCFTPKTCVKCGRTEGTELHCWVSATCTTPKTCMYCHKTEGQALGHTWKNATCTTPKTCNTCGTTSGTALGHQWSNATCIGCGAKAAKITKQPVSVVVGNGEKAKVTISATGDGLTYKWYYRNAGASKFSLTTSFKGNSYTVEMSSSRNGREVYCVITDKYGNSVTTDTVTLGMKTPLKITAQPTDVTVGKGQTAKVTVSATGDGLTYKWYYKNPGATKFSTTSTFTGNSYHISSMDAKRSGRQVYCVITDKYGNSVTTETVTIKMADPVKITKQPANVTVGKGETAKVTFTVTGDGLTYKWYYKNPGASKFSLTNSFKGNTYTISAMDAARSGRQVYCVITDKYGNKVTTDTVTITMQTPLKITKQPANVTVGKGETAKVTFSVQGDGLTYKWYFKNPGSSAFKVTGTFTGNTYSISAMDAARSGRQVYCVITDKYGNKVTTDTVTITMQTPLKITKQPTNVTVGKGETAKVTVSVTGDDLTYKWYYKNPGASKFTYTSTFTGNTYTISSMSSARDGRQVYCVITDKYGNIVQTVTVTLKMK